MFAGKSIAITGASSGLGAAIARRIVAFATPHEGVTTHLTLFARRQEALDATALSCREAGATVSTIAGDVTAREDCERFIDSAVGNAGGLDYLILNAGIGMWAAFEAVEDVDIYRRLMDTNYLGAIYCLHHALPELRRRHGMVVVISSLQGKLAVPYHTGYSASKHALQGFFDALRTEVPQSELDILLVHPHWIEGTNLRHHALGADGNHMGSRRRKHGHEAIPLDVCCDKILRAMARRRQELFIPWWLKQVTLLHELFPRTVNRFVLRKVKQQK